MEKKRRAPPVAQLALRIDRRVVGADKSVVQFIFSGKDRGDLGVFAHGVCGVQRGLISLQQVVDELQVGADV